MRSTGRRKTDGSRRFRWARVAMGKMLSADGPQTSAPRSFDLPHERRVDDPMPERLDEGHVSPPERTAWLDVDSHLSLVTPLALIDPGQVHHAVHGLVRDLRGEFEAAAVERRERHGGEIQIRRRVAEIVWQPALQRGFVRARDRQLAPPVTRSRDPAEPEPLAEVIAHVPQHASWE